MKFAPIPLAGAYVITMEPIEDVRGSFTEAWRLDKLAAIGVEVEIAGCNLSCNRRKGTLRGMHYQAAPHEQGKIVMCTRGSVFDVVIDIRPDSGTRWKWHGVILSRENRTGIYVPGGFAHGYQTLEDDTEILYHTTHAYHPESERGIRWDDPSISIKWPLPVSGISPKDASHAHVRP